ncbi:hypothetical protein DPX39_060051700 [Trypanosoma brucei equiperdum]|uniref:Dynein heavy chain region D6 P-loop domain-containing protein n=1 Tax=Trypanosoma brucei equiperdum TaxID=630700 RepID=A0A3L6L7C4_9TRYP|nr:hypothetical protein DPX39_060051700 [Trypanosoma brucei equiperdum]
MFAYICATAQEFIGGVHFGPDNRVVSVNTSEYPSLSGIQCGMVLTSINGTRVGQSEEEKLRWKCAAGELMLVFNSRAPGQHDELDLSSAEEDENLLDSQKTLLSPNLECDEIVFGQRKSVDVLIDAVGRTGPGGCIIIMSEGANPSYALTVAAEQSSRTTMYINAVARLKTRQPLTRAGEDFLKSLRKGLWIYIEQASKSMSLLYTLAESIEEARRSATIDANARVFLMCEPHPHFPEALLEGAVTLRSSLRPGTSEVMLEDNLLASEQKLRAVRGGSLVTSDGKAEITKVNARVKISHEVSIVPLEKNAFMELSRSATAPIEREAGREQGITRTARYTFGKNEKFISLCRVKDGCYAVGTLGGYVIMIDADGLPLIQFRPHKACIWDVAFASPHDFATACDDGASAILNYSLEAHEIRATSVASFQQEVFAVTYVTPDEPDSAVVSGGLSATICVLHSDRQVSSFISAGMTIQALRSTRQRHVIVGGGSGVCALIDPVASTILEESGRHKKKVPAVASYGALGVTGGFDKVVRLWDVRNGLRMVTEVAMPEVVTAVAAHGEHVAACCGSDLFVWDVRNLSRPLVRREKAWKDLTRGLVMCDNSIVTASADGVTRFWSLNATSE